MGRIGYSVLRIILYSDLSPLRVILGLSELMWGLSLLWPGASFDRPTYAGMQLLMPHEGAWGVLWIAIAVCQFCILFSGRLHTTFAVGFAAVNTLIWWYVVISMYMVFWPPAAAISGEVVLAIGSSWVFARSGWTPLGDRRNAH